MLHTKFQASESSGSEEEDFKYFSVYLYLVPRDLYLYKLGKEQLGNATYQISSI